MSEPLTERKRRILEVLSEQTEPIPTHRVNTIAFRSTTKVGVTKRELGDLALRGNAGFVEYVGMLGEEWQITDEGREALG